jgi:mannitol/fructose-specific phosphotransferase system IIA component (Ntr-type)
MRISELLNPEAMHLAMTGSSRDEILRDLVGLVPPLKGRPVEQDRLLQALIEREGMHSTGIGEGLALPHTRNTLGGLVERPLIAVGRHPRGVAFGAIDGKPVHLFFLLLTTSVTEHLSLLARLSRLLRVARLRTQLLSARDPAEIIAAVQQAEG